jgi:hypothetical protein
MVERRGVGEKGGELRWTGVGPGEGGGEEFKARVTESNRI